VTASAAELAILRTVATRLGALREEVVFVGGMIRSLLLTDPAAAAARSTDDIDVVAAIGSRNEYYELAERIRRLGFREDQREGAPLCRWIVEGLTVDVMPDRESALGFSNRWYPSVLATALWHECRAELIDETATAPIDVKEFIAFEVAQLLTNEAFNEAIPGHLCGDSASQARFPLIKQRLRQLARINIRTREK